MARAFTYVPSRTCQMFHDAELGTYLYKGIRGVPGSGKSVACCWDIRYKSEMQPVFEDMDGRMVRNTRWLVGRHTFDALKKTTIRTWLDWFPETVMHESAPLSGIFEAPSMHNDGSIVRIELLFYSMDSKNIMDDLPSLELSGAWINEASQIEFEKIHKVLERVGRFKPRGAAASGWKGLSFGIIMDTNTPVETNWWRDLEQDKKPERMLWFIQPPALIRTKNSLGKVCYLRNDEENSSRFGMSGPCENVSNHNDGWDYYERMLIGADEDYIKMHLLNQYGKMKSGLPIYPEWSDEIHRAKDALELHRGLPLLLGMDFGRNPACVIGQMTRMGQLRILDEVVAFGMGVPQFVTELLVPKLTNEYGWPSVRVMNYSDPAGQNKGEMYDISCIQYLNAKGIPTMPPKNLSNNDFDIRRDSVSQLLRSNWKGTPSLLVDQKCKTLIEGFNGGYCYRKIRGADGADRYSDKADKNEFSHIHDALQYLVVGASAGGYAGNDAQSEFMVDARSFEMAVDYDLV